MAKNFLSRAKGSYKTRLLYAGFYCTTDSHTSLCSLKSILVKFFQIHLSRSGAAVCHKYNFFALQKEEIKAK